LFGRYYLQFTAVRGRRGHAGDIGIDDVSLSPECVGLGKWASIYSLIQTHELVSIVLNVDIC